MGDETTATASPEGGRTTSDATPDLGLELSWFRALTLAERVRSLGGSGRPDDGDRDLAVRRRDRWRGQPPFADDPALWRRRLAAAGLSEEGLLAVLGARPRPTGRRGQKDGSPPPWLEEALESYAGASAQPFPWPAPRPGGEHSPFLPLVDPLVHRAVERLTRSAEAVHRRLPAAPFDPATVAEAFRGHLPELLSPCLGRVLVVELHAARLEGRLAGDGPEERFRGFLESLREPAVARELLAAYPVLARHLVTLVGRWQEAAEEFLERLAEDAPELSRRFAGGRDLGRLVEARGAVSDPHHGGRGVFLLRFDSGFRLVYKPRSLAVEAQFQRLLAWLGERGFEPGFRTLEIWDRGAYGWMEHVETAPVATREELRRFYLRHGGYLALLYLLDGTDLHHENVLAVGEHPLLVDLETLFHPPVVTRSLEDVDAQPGAPLRDSVLASGLLPQRVWASRDHAGVDISGIGAVAGQETPRPMLVPTARTTDEMRYERRPVKIPPSDNHPRLGDEEVSPLDFVEEIEAGFERLSDVVEAHREELLSPEGPLAGFTEAEVRVLIRPTMAYGTLLIEAYHPHAMGEALERERFFDRLWLGVGERPYLAALVPSEVRDLLDGDVPRFTGRPGSRDLQLPNGERLSGFFEDTGLERVARKIARLGRRARARELAVVRDSFMAVRLSRTRFPRPTYELREARRPARPEELLAAAGRLGRCLADRAFRSSREAHWLGLEPAEPEGWVVAPVAPDLYLGLPGIALFLGFLGALEGEGEELGELARLALAGQRVQIETEPERVTGIGAFNGWGGVIYALSHLGALWRDDGLLDEAESYVDRIAEALPADDLFDVVAGAAGALLSLLSFRAVRPSQRLDALIHRCGERIVEGAEPQARGVGWRMPLAGDRVLAGLSHGAAGIALALLRAWELTGEERFRATALEAIEFERSVFREEEANWPDLRVDETAADPVDADERFLCAWCHGASGVGLARLSGLSYLDDRAVRGEIATAVGTTLEKGLGRNHCLCHGDLGNLDILAGVARTLGDRELEARVYRLAAGVLAHGEEHGWLFGLQGGVETPGLMVGLAGVGYGLLRLAAPGRVPDVLAVAPPGSI